MSLIIYINSLKEKHEVWRQAFNQYFSGMKIHVRSAAKKQDYHDADFIIQGFDLPCVDHQKCSQLKAIASPGAGVDHILFDAKCQIDWPENIPVLRVRNEALGQKVSNYVLMRALYFHLHMHHYRYYQKKQRWTQHQIGGINRVGILGLGDTGMNCALRLKDNGFDVCGWRKHAEKDSHDIPVYTGSEGLLSMIRSCNFLINALPLTDETFHLLTLFHFQKMPIGSCFLNIGRGSTIIAEDLIHSLSSGHLTYAYLDVFAHEPLPKEAPEWVHPQIHLTPHIAGRYEPKSSAKALSQDFQMILEGKPAINQIDYRLKY